MSRWLDDDNITKNTNDTTNNSGDNTTNSAVIIQLANADVALNTKVDSNFTTLNTQISNAVNSLNSQIVANNANLVNADLQFKAMDVNLMAFWLQSTLR